MPSKVVAARSSVAPRETRLEAWHRLHDPKMVEPKKVRTQVISDQAKAASKKMNMSPRAWQDMLDGLEGAAKANAFWPALKQMGVTSPQASAAVRSLKAFDADRRTSLLPHVGVVGLKKEVARAAQLTGVVNGLLAGKPIDSLVKGLDANQAKVLLQAKRLGPAFVLHSAITMLDSHLAHTITDNPADLLTFPKETEAALEASLKGRTAWLKLPAKDSVDASTYVSVSGIQTEFGHLRELAVLNPAKAQTLGKAYVTALKAAAAGSSSDFAIK